MRNKEKDQQSTISRKSPVARKGAHFCTLSLSSLFYLLCGYVSIPSHTLVFMAIGFNDP